MTKSFYTHFQHWGDQILLRYVDDFGRRVTERIRDFKPTLYVKAKAGAAVDARDIHGSPLAKIECASIKEAKELIQQFDGVAGSAVYGYDKWSNAYVASRWNPEDVSLNWRDDKISIFYSDLEMECEHGFPDPATALDRINIATFIDTLTHRTYVFALGDWTPDKDDVVFFPCETEKELLEKIVALIEKLQPDIITGWNLERFDIPYLVARIEKILGEEQVKRLSPWNRVTKRTVPSQWGESIVVDIMGVSIIDMMDVYKKLVRDPRESYKLDHVAKVDLNDEKLKHESGIPGHLLYKSHFGAAVDYNVKDARLLVDLEANRNLIRTVMVVAYSALVNYGDVMSQIRTWDNTIYFDRMRAGVQFRLGERPKSKDAFEGAYVKPPLVGKKRWVVSFDVASEYPSLIRALNISPEKLIESHVGPRGVDRWLEDDVGSQERALDYAVGANGACFKRDSQGFMPALVKRMFDERSTYKKKMLATQKLAEAERDPVKKRELKDEAQRWDLLQNARKVQLNSLYGAMGNNFFRFYDLRMAECITLSGQLLIRWVARDVNEYVNKITGTTGVDYVIAIDTDSIYVDFGAFVDKTGVDQSDKTLVVDSLSSFCGGKVQDVINASFAKLAAKMNAFEPGALAMKREAIADAGIFMAKKRYMLNVLDNEGVRYEKGKLKIMGTEAVKSSTPGRSKKWMKEIYPVMLFGDEKQLQDKVSKFRAAFDAMAPEDIAHISSISDLSKWDAGNGRSAKGTPIHCRAAIVYNHAIKKHGIADVHPAIREGDKLKYVRLRTPNKVESDVFAWAEDWPSELKLDDYIDRDAQFAKTFQNAIEPIAKILGWDVVEKPRLDWMFE